MSHRNGRGNPTLEKRAWGDTSRELFEERKNYTSHVIPSHSHLPEFNNEAKAHLLSMRTREEEWNLKNLNSGDLKYTISDTIAHLRSKPPRDRCRGIAISLMCQGMAIMTALTAFMLNIPYFAAAIRGVYVTNATDALITESSNHSESQSISAPTNVFSQAFAVYHQAAIFLPFVLAALIHTLCQGSQRPSTRRAVVCMSAMFVPVILSAIFVMLDDRFPRYVYMAVYLISFVIIGAVAGVLLSIIFSLAPLYPPKYVNFVLVGMTMAGIIICLVQIVVKLFTESLKIRTMYCLVTSVLFSSLGVVVYLLITLSRLHRHYKYLNYLVGKDYFETEVKPYQGFPYTMRAAGCVLASAFVVHFTSSSIYPFVLSDTPFPYISNYIPFPDDFWPLITNLLIYNVFTLLGNIIAHAWQAPSPGCVGLPTIARFIVVIPLYGITNYRQYTRRLPYFIDLDVCKLTITGFTAFTGGYLISLAIIYAPRLVQVRYSSVAGMLSAVFIALGMGAGVCASHLYAFIVDTLGP